MTSENGDTELLSTFAPDVIQSIYATEDGYQNRYLLAHGLYLLEAVDLSDGKPDFDTRTTYAYSATPPDMEVPAPQTASDLEVVVFDGGEFSSEVHSYTSGLSSKQVFGDCVYEVIEVRVDYNDSDSSSDFLQYFPQLGISYLAGSAYDTAEGRQTESYPLATLIKQ